MKARHLTKAHVQHLLLSDSFSSNSLSGIAESNGVGRPVAAHSFKSSKEHRLIDQSSDICSAIIAEYGNTMVFTY